MSDVSTPEVEQNLRELVDLCQDAARGSKKRPGVSRTQLCVDTGLSPGAVIRFFDGYVASRGEKTADPAQGGRVRLNSFIAIAQRLGFWVVLKPKTALTTLPKPKRAKTGRPPARKASAKPKKRSRTA